MNKLRLCFSTLLVLLLVGCTGNQVTKMVEINSEDDVSGLTVAVQAGSIYDFQMSERADVQVVRYNNPPDIVAALKSGQADVYKDDEIAMSPGSLRRNQLRQEYICDEKYDVAYAFRKEDVATVNQFNNFLDEIQANGIYDEVHRRWYETEEPDSVLLPEIEMVKEGQPLRVVTGLVMAPLCFRKGEIWTGFEMELLYRFAAYAKRPMEVNYLEPSSGSAALLSGLADVWSSCLFITPEREEKVLFSKPYNACHPAYFVYDKNIEVSTAGIWDSLKDSFQRNLIDEDRWLFLVDGLWETLIISVFSLLLGTLLAGFVCWMRMSRFRWLNMVAIAYIDILRGVPLLVILMLMFYVVLAGTGLSATFVAIISFALVFAAYVSEMFRSAINGVNKGQSEAGVALGFTPLQTFIYVVLPQAAKAVMPVYKGEAVSLFKNTSIVGYIAIQDLTKASDLIRSRTFDAFFPLIVISIIYFVLAWLLGKFLERTVKTKQS